MPRQVEARAWAEASAAARTLGQQVELLAGCQKILLEEAGKQLEAVRVAPFQGHPAAHKRSITRLAELFEWLACNSNELSWQAAKATDGFVCMPTADVLRDAVGAVGQQFGDVRFRLAEREPDCRVLIDPFQLFQAFSMALGLVANRIGRSGRVDLSVAASNGWLRHEISGHTGSGRLEAPDTEVIAQVRRLVCERHGGRILPVTAGEAAPGMVIALPQGVAPSAE
jgi:hypothetical protein